MDLFIATLQAVTYDLTQFGMVMFQLAAVLIMVYACISTLARFIKHQHHTVIQLRKWMNVALLFILCSEILRLTNVHTLEEVGVIFFIIVIHVIISVLSHWEMKHELEMHKENEVDNLEELMDSCYNDINL